MKKSFQTEMDDTQQAVSQIVCLCTTIALHQEFGVGKTRLDRRTFPLGNVLNLYNHNSVG